MSLSRPLTRPFARPSSGPSHGQGRYRLPNFGTIYRCAYLGDSITNAASGTLYEGTGFRANGFASWMRYASYGMIELVENPVEPSWDFGVSGARTDDFQPAGNSRATFEAALASDADTVVYALGVNDIGYLTAAETKSNMLAQWAEIQAAGKQLVIVGLFASGTGQVAGFMEAVRPLNSWIAATSATIGAVYFDPTATCDDNHDGYSDAPWLTDEIHPNIPGSARIGYPFYTALSPYLSEANRFAFPAAASPSWITPNPYASGTLGSNQTATNWAIAATGGSTAAAKNLIARTDITGNWQEIVVTGAANANVLITNPTDYVQAYLTASFVSIAEGDRFYGVCEIQPAADSTFYGYSLRLTNESSGTGTRRYDMADNGNFASVDAGYYCPVIPGLLRTPDLVAAAAATHTLRCWLTLYGNGTMRVGRFGLIKA